MKGIPIKFRGEDFYNTGSWVYGGCLQIHTGTTYIISGWGGESRKFYRVKPESVEQLVRVDCRGHEIYENDDD